MAAELRPARLARHLECLALNIAIDLRRGNESLFSAYPASRVRSPARRLKNSSVFLGGERLKKYQGPFGNFICAIALPLA